MKTSNTIIVNFNILIYTAWLGGFRLVIFCETVIQQL